MLAKRGIQHSDAALHNTAQHSMQFTTPLLVVERTALQCRTAREGFMHLLGAEESDSTAQHVHSTAYRPLKSYSPYKFVFDR